MTKGTKLFYILLTFAIIGFFMILIPFIILTIQSKEIMPNNNNKEKEKEIKEEKNLIMIFIDKYPNKLQYKEGEIFDDKGVILKAYYDDNTSPQIFDYKIDNTSPLTIYTQLNENNIKNNENNEKKGLLYIKHEFKKKIHSLIIYKKE
jgi:hypothetical protein